MGLDLTTVLGKLTRTCRSAVAGDVHLTTADNTVPVLGGTRKRSGHHSPRPNQGIQVFMMFDSGMTPCRRRLEALNVVVLCGRALPATPSRPQTADASVAPVPVRCALTTALYMPAVA